MPELKLVCDNCDSSFSLIFEEEEVSHSPSHCPFCGDYYDSENEELDFNIEDDENDYSEEDLDNQENDVSRWH